MFSIGLQLQFNISQLVPKIKAHQLPCLRYKQLLLV